MGKWDTHTRSNLHPNPRGFPLKIPTPREPFDKEMQTFQEKLSIE